MGCSSGCLCPYSEEVYSDAHIRENEWQLGYYQKLGVYYCRGTDKMHFRKHCYSYLRRKMRHPSDFVQLATEQYFLFHRELLKVLANLQGSQLKRIESLAKDFIDLWDYCERQPGPRTTVLSNRALFDEFQKLVNYEEWSVRYALLSAWLDPSLSLGFLEHMSKTDLCQRINNPDWEPQFEDVRWFLAMRKFDFRLHNDDIVIGTECYLFEYSSFPDPRAKAAIKHQVYHPSKNTVMVVSLMGYRKMSLEDPSRCQLALDIQTAHRMPDAQRIVVLFVHGFEFYLSLSDYPMDQTDGQFTLNFDGDDPTDETQCKDFIKSCFRDMNVGSERDYIFVCLLIMMDSSVMLFPLHMLNEQEPNHRNKNMWPRIRVFCQDWDE